MSLLFLVKNQVKSHLLNSRTLKFKEILPKVKNQNHQNQIQNQIPMMDLKPKLIPTPILNLIIKILLVKKILQIHPTLKIVLLIRRKRKREIINLLRNPKNNLHLNLLVFLNLTNLLKNLKLKKISSKVKRRIKMPKTLLLRI